MTARLTCERCHTPLVATYHGLKCPRLGACGRGGIIESGSHLHPFSSHVAVPTGVRA